MKNRVKVSQIAVIVIALLFLAASLTIKPLSELTISSDAAYPILVSVLSLIFAIWIFFDERSKKADGASAKEGFFNKEVLALIGLMALYGVLLFLLGYVLSTLIFTVLAISYLHEKNWKMGMLIGFISTFMIVFVFKYCFNVILP